MLLVFIYLRASIYSGHSNSAPHGNGTAASEHLEQRQSLRTQLLRPPAGPPRPRLSAGISDGGGDGHDGGLGADGIVGNVLEALAVVAAWRIAWQGRKRHHGKKSRERQEQQQQQQEARFATDWRLRWPGGPPRRKSTGGRSHMQDGTRSPQPPYRLLPYFRPLGPILWGCLMASLAATLQA